MLRIVNARIPEDHENEFPPYYRGIKYIGISWINSYFFCPYQIYLEKVKGVRGEVTKEMKHGTEAHLNLQIEHEIAVEEVIGIREALELSREESTGFRFREVRVIAKMDRYRRRYQIGGRLDELLILPDRVVVIDDKPNKHVAEEYVEKFYRGAIMQTYAYALALKEMYNIDRRLDVEIRDRDTGESIIPAREFTSEHEKILIGTLDEMYRILKGKNVPSIRPSINRCRNCRFKDFCDIYARFFSGVEEH